ncbi:metallophosphoesterase, partial [Brevundimonas sp.]
MSQSFISRRHLLQWAACLPLAGAVAGCAHSPVAQSRPKLRVLAISDLHSSYGRIAQLLAAFRAEVASSDAPHLIVVNGDSFEKGNVVSVRSEGAIDWAFMAELPKIAPTVFNLGNHDNDLVHDLHPVVARMRSLGLTVVSNLIDKRTGQPYAPSTAQLSLGDETLRIVGLGTP